MEKQSCLVEGQVGTILMHFPGIFLLMKCNLHRYLMPYSQGLRFSFSFGQAVVTQGSQGFQHCQQLCFSLSDLLALTSGLKSMYWGSSVLCAL